MRKFVLIFVSAIFLIAACSQDGYTEYSLYSYSDFEFDSSYFTDSLFLSNSFYGGSSSAYIVFNSNRDNTGDEMTGGFGLSMKRDSSLTIDPSNLYPQYTMYATTAGWQSDVCAVFYQNEDEDAMPEHDIIFNNSTYGTCTPSYIQVNNSQLTIYNILSDESSLKFESGDYLTLTFTGYNGNSVTGTVSCTLADYTGLVPTLVTDWTTVSLTSLGQIQYIDLTLETNKANFPTTVCVDNLVASIYIKY